MPAPRSWPKKEPPRRRPPRPPRPRAGPAGAASRSAAGPPRLGRGAAEPQDGPGREGPHWVIWSDLPAPSRVRETPQPLWAISSSSRSPPRYVITLMRSPLSHPFSRLKRPKLPQTFLRHLPRIGARPPHTWTRGSRVVPLLLSVIIWGTERPRAALVLSPLPFVTKAAKPGPAKSSINSGCS
ncbi:atherin-like isoform X1 [Corvus hawaiiensis]|uniref:atherin-like isoform X1 n=1 Tax=Corvus hawaiiensis TaxID=134902 RepID=UPI002019ECB7|nr:atherin-like isoform X1 [Corvus hawaiiensis]